MRFTENQIRAVMIKNGLCSNGYVYRQWNRQIGTSEQIGVVGQMDSDMMQMVNTAADRMEGLARVKTPSCMIGSYRLKHVLERDGYISNGAAIVAAILLGIRVVPNDAGPNALVGISRSKAER